MVIIQRIDGTLYRITEEREQDVPTYTLETQSQDGVWKFAFFQSARRLRRVLKNNSFKIV